MIMNNEAAVDAALEQIFEATHPVIKQRRWYRRVFRWLSLAFTGLVAAWIFAAYVALPWAWRHYEHQPGLESAPKFSVTGAGIPGDPLNLGVVGAQEALVARHARRGVDAGRPDLVADEPGDRPERPGQAPVSHGAGQQPVRLRPQAGPGLREGRRPGGSASQRHHVRFWRSDDLGPGGVPFWLGAATFDRSVGFSHLTGQITHHIAADIDAERNAVIAGLGQLGWLTQEYQVTGVGATLLGRNGGGDRYDTDGELTIGVLAAAPPTNREPAPDARSTTRPPSTSRINSGPPSARSSGPSPRRVSRAIDSRPAHRLLEFCHWPLGWATLAGA